MLAEHKKARILVVEDDYCIGVLFQALLKPRYEVELADTFNGALASATRHHFDLFLLDIDLGETRTGIDLLALLRQMPASGSTPAVACTSFTGEENRKHLLLHGFDGYLEKPFTRPELLDLLEQTLAGKRWESRGPRVAEKTTAPGINPP